MDPMLLESSSMPSEVNEGNNSPTSIEDTVKQIETIFYAAHPEMEEKIIQMEKREELRQLVRERLDQFIAKNSEFIQWITFDAKPDALNSVIQSLQNMLNNYTFDIFLLCADRMIKVDEATKMDTKTNLLNKAGLMEKIKEGVERNRRYDEKSSFLFIDIDHFKQVNDTLGHEVGDQVLIELARRLKEDVHFRPLDTIARYGGEEFAVLLPHTSQTGALVSTLRVREAVTRIPFCITTDDGEKKELSISLSFGISEYSDVHSDPTGKKMIDRADQGLYIIKGKRAGKDLGSEEMVIKDRRGLVALNDEVYSWEQIEKLQEELRLSGKRESTLPPPKVKQK